MCRSESLFFLIIVSILIKLPIGIQQCKHKHCYLKETCYMLIVFQLVVILVCLWHTQFSPWHPATVITKQYLNHLNIPLYNLCNYCSPAPLSFTHTLPAPLLSSHHPSPPHSLPVPLPQTTCMTTPPPQTHITCTPPSHHLHPMQPTDPEYWVLHIMRLVSFSILS